MAITDNAFDATELGAALTANADLIPILKGVLTDQLKYSVLDETEKTNLLKDHETTVSTALTSKHATKLESDVLKLTGIPKKDANEKYYEYLNRAYTEKFGSYTAMQTELEALKQGHKPSEIDKQRITQLETALQSKDTDFNEKLSAKDKEIAEIRNNSAISTDLAGVRTKYKKDISEGIIKTVENAVVEQLKKDVVFQADGTATIMEVGADGKPAIKMDKATYKPVTIAQELEERLSDLIDTGKKAAGAGGGADGPKGPGAAGKTEVTALPDHVKNRQQLTTHLLENGYLQNDADFTEAFNKLGEKLPLW